MFSFVIVSISAHVFSHLTYRYRYFYISTELSESDVLSLIPPGVEYVHRPDRDPSTTATISIMRRTPMEVVEWDDFLDEVAFFTPSDIPKYKEKYFEFDEDLRVSNESDLYSALDRNVYNMLARLAGPHEHFGSHSAITMQGDPDRIFYVDPGFLRFAIEVKTKYVLPFDDDLVSKYNNDIEDHNQDRTSTKSTVYQVQQIFGYLSHNRLRYGVLTTYEQTWFLKRDRGKLYVSPAIGYSDEDPTLFQCYACIMGLARHGHTNPPAPPSPAPLPPDDPPDDYDDSDDSDYDPKGGDHSRSNRKRSKQGDDDFSQSKMKKKNRGSRSGGPIGGRVITRRLSTGFSVTIGEAYLPEFECQDLLGEGRTGRVFRAGWRGEIVAVKICDLYQHPDYEEEVLTEVAAYDALKALQGLCIPHFKLAGYDGGIFVIATEIAGSPLEVDKLNHQELLEVVDKLSLIHTYGILHNDIRPDNILIRRHDDGIKVCFIDFAMSKRTGSKLELKNEIIKLEKLLGLLVGEILDLKPQKFGLHVQ